MWNCFVNSPTLSTLKDYDCCFRGWKKAERGGLGSGAEQSQRRVNMSQGCSDPRLHRMGSEVKSR